MSHVGEIAVLILASLWLVEGRDYEVLRNNSGQCYLHSGFFFRFLYKKMYVTRRKSATKFLCVKTFSSKVVRHSLAYLAVHKWLVGDVLST